MLHITDLSSVDLMGSIQWDNITTVGTGGALNLTGTINLTGLNYGGGNTSILGTLAAAGSAADVVTFEFLPPQSLSDLTTGSGESAYSGVISTVPEPGHCVDNLLLVSLWAWRAAFAGAGNA